MKANPQPEALIFATMLLRPHSIHRLISDTTTMFRSLTPIPSFLILDTVIDISRIISLTRWINTCVARCARLAKDPFSRSGDLRLVSMVTVGYDLFGLLAEGEMLGDLEISVCRAVEKSHLMLQMSWSRSQGVLLVVCLAFDRIAQQTLQAAL